MNTIKMSCKYTELVLLILLFFVTVVTLSPAGSPRIETQCEQKLNKCNIKLESVTKLSEQLWDKYVKLIGVKIKADNDKIKAETMLKSAKYELENGDRKDFGLQVSCSWPGPRSGTTRIVSNPTCQNRYQACAFELAARKNDTKKIKDDISGLKSKIKQYKEDTKKIYAELVEVRKQIAEKQRTFLERTVPSSNEGTDRTPELPQVQQVYSSLKYKH